MKVSTLALVALVAFVAMVGATVVEPATAAEPVNVDTLFQHYLKLKSKIAAAVTAPFTTVTEQDANTAPAADATAGKDTQKNARKLEEKKLQLAALEQQLKDLGVDIAAKEQQLKDEAAAEAAEKQLHSQFLDVWIAKLHGEGRTAQAQLEEQKKTGIKNPKRSLTPAQKAEEKLEKLKYKVEREEFKLKWLAEQKIQQQQQQQQQQQHVA